MSKNPLKGMSQEDLQANLVKLYKTGPNKKDYKALEDLIEFINAPRLTNAHDCRKHLMEARLSMKNVSSNPQVAKALERDIRNLLLQARDLRSLFDISKRIVLSGAQFNTETLEVLAESINRVKREIFNLRKDTKKDPSSVVETSQNNLNYIVPVPINSISHDNTKTSRKTEPVKSVEIIERIEQNAYNASAEEASKSYIRKIGKLSAIPQVEEKKPIGSSSVDFISKIGKENPSKITSTVTKVARDQEPVRKLKSIYEDRCQVCGERIWVGQGDYYSEVHHIRPLGGHEGSDTPENMIVLCPNHHVMFDKGVIIIDLNLKAVYFKDKCNPLNGKEVTLKHTIAKGNIEYYKKNIYNQA